MLISARDITYAYPSTPTQLVFSPLKFELCRGSIVRIDGRNGSGKTTLLKILSGDIEPLSGTLEIEDGVKIVYLDQNVSDFVAPCLTVSEQLNLICENVKSQTTQGNSASKLLKKVGLSTQSDKFIGELSGGQRQVVAFLSVLQCDFDVLLLDEFTSHMDKDACYDSWNILKAIREEAKKGVIFVDHSGSNGIPIDGQIDLQ